MSQYDVTVLGLGVTGFATAEFCIKLGWSVAVTDDRPNPPLLERLRNQYPHIPIATGSYDQDLLANSERIVVSPGIAPNAPVISWCQAQNKELISDIDLFLEHYEGKLLAVTGSNGKSTTVKMLHDLINHTGKQSFMVGNIGKPVLAHLAEKKKPCDWLILEVSSFQLHWTRNMRADIGVLLNIYPNHLDWHDNFRAYQDAKCKLLSCSKKVIMPQALQSLAELHGFSNRVSAWIPSYSCLNQSALEIDSRIIDALPYALHKSAIATSIIASVLNIDQYTCIRTLEEFQPWPFRCQHESSRYGEWYNDAKSSNLAAARYAIESVSRKHGHKVIWIAGGVTKNEDFSQVARWASKFVSQAVVYGQDKQHFIDAMKGACSVSPVDTLHDAIRLAHKMMKKKDIVVYSPAAASFDQFENYQHRGQYFSEQLAAVLPE